MAKNVLILGNDSLQKTLADKLSKDGYTTTVSADQSPTSVALNAYDFIVMLESQPLFTSAGYDITIPLKNKDSTVPCAIVSETVYKMPNRERTALLLNKNASVLSSDQFSYIGIRAQINRQTQTERSIEERFNTK